MKTCQRIELLVTTLALAVFALPAAVRAQLQVNESGRAFDAPGSVNTLNAASGGGLNSALGSAAVGSPFRLNAFSEPNLRSLSAAIDPNNTLYIPPVDFNAARGGSFGLQDSVIPLGVAQPFGTPATSFSANVLGHPSFYVAPLPSALRQSSLPTASIIPSLDFFRPSSFDLALPAANTLVLPPSPSNTVSDPLLGSINRPPARSAWPPTISNYYEEEILGGGSLLEMTDSLTPNFIRPTATPDNKLARTLTGENGLIPKNFGYSPSSGVTGAVEPTTTSPERRAEIARELQQFIMRPADLPHTTAAPLQLPGVPGLDSFGVSGSGLPTGASTVDPLFRLGNAYPYPLGLPENSLIEETLKQARHVAIPGFDTDVTRFKTPDAPPGGGFGLEQPPVTEPAPGSAPPVNRPVYSRMKQAADRVNRLRSRQERLAQSGEQPPALAESFSRAMNFIRSTSDHPLTSLVGDGDDPTTQWQRTAEEFLKDGEFRRAVSHYEVARVTDPDNPLLLLGQGHALIGTGEYAAAVRKIEQAIQRFPEIAYFDLDLNQFITDPDLLDIRRADLEKRLAQFDDYRLRFLLGYIEYYTGLQGFGLENLKAAAAAAPPDSPIAGFPEMLMIGDRLRSQPQESALQP